MSTLRGLVLIKVRLDVPPAGGWLAIVKLASGPVPALGPATLVVGDLSLPGRIILAGEDSPDQPTATVAGGAGWDALLARRGAYDAPSGVQLLTVLSDLSRLVGETYDAPADVFLGTAYAWPRSFVAGPVRARAVLSDLVARGALPTWRVDPSSGRTRFDAWPAVGPADGACKVLSRELAQGVRRVGLDGLVAALLPGSTLEGATTRRLTVHDSAGALTAEVRTQ